MKKRIITLLLALTCCVPFFAGCDDAESPDAPDANTTEPTIITGTITNWKVPTPEKGSDGLYAIIVNDFERPADFNPVTAGQVGTAASVEKKIVHSGNQSLKITKKVESNSYTEANVRQFLNIEHRKDYSSLKTVKKISFWVYNAQAKPQELTLSFKYTKDEAPAFYYTEEIPSKEWTLVTIDLTTATAWYWKDAQQTTQVKKSIKDLLKNDTVERLTFSFKGHSSAKESVFYIDDVCLHSTVPM